MAEITAAGAAATMTTTELPAHIRRDDAVDQADAITTTAMTQPPSPAQAAAAVEVEYLSAGANRQTAVADWGDDGLVAFGADSNVALWRPRDPTNKGVAALLSGHTDAVKAVKFLPRVVGDDEGTSYLLSGSDDKALRIWSVRSTSDLNKTTTTTTTTTAKCIQTTQSHTAPVNCIAILKENSTTAASSSGSKRIFATGAADATIKIWTFDGAESRVVQTIKPTPKFFPLALALSRLGGDSGDDNGPLILAAAGTRDTIQLFVAESSVTEGLEFKHQATLSGHEGWIRSLDFVREPQDDNRGGDLLLASASQDKYIRLWRFHQGAELPPQIRSEGNDPSLGAYLPGRSPSNKAHRLSVVGEEYSVTFEALLLGHDDWIYSAKWFVRRRRSAPVARLQLLSTSADNTLTIWEADPASGIWLSSVRLGEISREKGATTATGSTGGFWTGLWSADGNSVTCLGRTGSWRVWNYSGSSTDDADDNGGDDDGQWLPQVGISGHTRAVTGIAWAKNGDYLLSTSLDQTTRLHAAWKRKGNNNNIDDEQQQQRRRETWHEMSRPQIHGYDLNCIDTLGATSFVSGADEKLMRVFTEPRAVANLLESLGGIVVAPDANSSNHNSSGGFLPDAANMPVLGLSNKAIEAVDDDAELDNQLSADPHNVADRDALDPAMMVRKSHLAAAPTRPPLEDTLSRHTLWPEAEKLYGHGYELSCLAASHDGRLVASACRASSLNHAVIRLFETERWTEVRPPLAAHTLTATRLRWSADDRYLLSVGRDRAWAVFERVDAGSGTAADAGAGAQQEGAPVAAEGQFRLKQTNPKGHTRMILDAAWAPPLPSPPGGSETGQQRLVFATAGRDKQVKLWHQTPPPFPASPSTPTDAAAPATEAEATSGSSSNNSSSSEIVLAGSISETHPVTAIDFLPHHQQHHHHDLQGTPVPASHPSFVLAVGTETGKITIHRIDCATLGVVSSMEIPGHLCLAKAVLQLSWRPPRSPQARGRDTTREEEEEVGVRANNARSELAVAGDDGSLRIYSFR